MHKKQKMKGRKNMKKISLVLALLLIFSLLASCNEGDTPPEVTTTAETTTTATEPLEPKYTVLEYRPYLISTYGNPNRPDDVPNLPDSDTYYESFTNENAAPTLSIKINGIKKTLSYSGSVRNTVSLYTNIDEYDYTDNDFSLSAGVNTITNQVAYVGCYYGDSYYAKKESSNAQELDHLSKSEIAEEFLASKVKNSKAFLEADDSTTEKGTTLFKYVRCINGVETFETFDVEVNKYGDIVSYKNNSGYLGDKEPPSLDEILEMKKYVDEKIAEIFEGYVIDYTATIEYVRLTRLYDGRHAMEFCLWVDSTPYGTYFSSEKASEMIFLFIPIE